MIGQKNIINSVKNLILERSFPHFCIIAGSAGSGKKTLVNEVIVPELGALIYPVDVGIESIRNMIKSAYTVKASTVYLIADADKMSIPAQNALLKLVEEPPNDAHIIMTLEDMNNVLDTIRSRAAVYIMANYAKADLEKYAEALPITDEALAVMLDIAETPGEIDMLFKHNIVEFYDYVRKVFDNIGDVTVANSFKIAEKLSLKNDAEGYDLKLFFKLFMRLCLNQLSSNPIHYSARVTITSKFLQQLRIKGVSKQMLLDAWILEIRQAK